MVDWNFTLGARTGLRWTFVVLLVLLTSLALEIEISEEGNEDDGSDFPKMPPHFTSEPPDGVSFTNNSGAQVACIAQGYPPPVVTWTYDNGSPVENAESSGLRRVLPNGTLAFSPFRAEDFRQDVHDAAYRCVAANAAGTIVSRLVHVRAVVLQPYAIQVHDVTALLGNAAIFQCNLPNQMKDFVTVTSWIKDDEIDIEPANPIEDSKYTVLSSGELFVKDVQLEDNGSLFRCRTQNSLTGELRTSNNSGRLVVTSTDGGVAPKISFSKAEVTANEHHTVVIPCVAEGYPAPEVKWFARLVDGLFLPIHYGERMEKLGVGLLIQRAQVSDSGAYVCDVKNDYGNARGETAAIITEPLSVTIQPVNQTVDVGSPAVFRCHVSGHPVNKVRWLRNGHFLKTSSEELSLPAVRWSDAGVYQCLAENSRRSAQAVAQLLLGDIAPEFVRSFAELKLEPGSNASLECAVIGSPAPRLSWLFEDQPLSTEEERFTLDETTEVDGTVVSSLSVSDAQNEDGGVYRCVAINRVATAELAARLNVFGPISIRPMPPISAVTGRTVVVHCPVYGYPIDNIQWWKDGESLPQNLRQFIYANGTLVLVDVRKGIDAGRYTCVASNRRGESEEQDVQIRILVPPKISPFKFEDQMVREGMRARLQCVVVEGDEPLTVRWYKDRRPIVRETTSGLTVRDLDQFSSILTIRSVTPQHNGNYTCVASNAADTVSHSAEMYINVAPKIIPFDFQGGHLFEGVLNRVSCVVFQGDLPLNISWSKDGGPIPGDSGISVKEFDEYSSLLTIAEVAPRHSGNYTCTARNHAAVAQHTAELIVNVPPRWKLKPQDTLVVVGEDAVLNCQAEGFPEPTVSWMWSTEVSPAASKRVIGRDDRHHLYLNGSLVIKKCSAGQQGYYFCQAVNNVGPSISAVGFLAVKFPAKLEVGESNVTVHHSKSFTLACKANGDFPMNFTWTKDNATLPLDFDRYKLKEVVVNGGMTSELSVLGTLGDDSGSYSCDVQNAFGVDNTTFKVIIQEKPDAPTMIMADEIGSRLANISWPAPSDGNSAIFSYKMDYKLCQAPTEEVPISGDVWNSNDTAEMVETIENRTVITNLKPASSYCLRISATNEVGTGQPSATVVITTKEEAPSGPPLEVVAEAINQKVLRVCWMPPTSVSWNGALKGYWVGYKIWGSADLPQFKSFAMVTNASALIGGKQCANVTGMKKFIRYSVIVQAYNDVGRGPSSADLMAMTAEGVPSESANNVACISLTSQSIRVTWQPPHLERLNGILQGYKVMISAGGDGNFTVAQNTTGQEVVIGDLEKFSNYNIKIVAFTRAGDGTPTESLSCRTIEDVPGPPAAFRAMITAHDSVLVTWKPPLRANGVVTQFNVHMKEEWEKSQGSLQWSVPTDVLQYEIPSLKENQKYSFWLTASTSAGEGISSKVITLIPKGPFVPAQAVSFDETITGTWRQMVKLPCVGVGVPEPEKRWLYGETPIKPSPKLKVQQDGTLQIKDAQGYHSGMYTCILKNKVSKDKVRFTVQILAPPAAPTIQVNLTTKSSLLLDWLPGPNHGAEIKGYVLNFREKGGTWEQIDLDPETLSYELTELQCGTVYEVFVFAINDIGKGDVSVTISAATNGTVPLLLHGKSVIEEGANSLTLHLDKVVNGECPVEQYLIEYKQKHSDLWLLLDKEIPVDRKSVLIADLLPATWYNLRLVARSTSGTATAEYEVATLALHGGTVTPNMETTVLEDGRSILFYIDLRIVIPIAACIGLLLLALIIMCVCVEKKKELGQQSPRKVPKAEKTNNSHLARRPKEQEGAADSFTYLRRTSGDTKRQKCSSPQQDGLIDSFNDDEISRTDSYYDVDGVCFNLRPVTDEMTPYTTYHHNNATELQTFQQRTSAPVPQTAATDTEEDAIERVKLQLMQQFPRPKSYTPANSNMTPPNQKWNNCEQSGTGYANVLAESPSTGKKKLRQVAIPTAPPVLPGFPPLMRDSQGSQGSIHSSYQGDSLHLRAQQSRPATPNHASSTPIMKHKQQMMTDMSLPLPPPELDFPHPEADCLSLPPNNGSDVSPVYSNVADAREFMPRQDASMA